MVQLALILRGNFFVIASLLDSIPIRTILLPMAA